MQYLGRVQLAWAVILAAVKTILLYYEKTTPSIFHGIPNSLGLTRPSWMMILMQHIENAPESIRSLLVAHAWKSINDRPITEKQPIKAVHRPGLLRVEDLGKEPPNMTKRNSTRDPNFKLTSYNYILPKNVLSRHQQYLNEWSKYGYLNREQTCSKSGGRSSKKSEKRLPQ